MYRHALTFSLALTLLATTACAHTPGAPARVNQAEALAAMQAWEFGDTRETLTVVEDIVRDAANGPDSGAALAATLAGLLSDPATTHDARQFICRQLAIIGTEAEVPALAPLLLDPATSDMARYALEPIPGAAVDAALLAALPQTQGAAKIGIITSLGARRTGEARTALTPLAADPDPAVAAAATAALAQLGG